MTTIRLSGSDIDGDACSCLVAHFILVFEALDGVVPEADVIWYLGDVEPDMGVLAAYGSAMALPIGNTRRVLELLTTVTFAQLDWGLFAALPARGESPLPSKIAIAGEPGEPPGCVPGSLIEVEAVDDTYIEIMSNRPDVMQAIRDRFGGTVVAE